MAGGTGRASVLIVPGLGGSGPGHWQSIWQARNPNYRRVEQLDWDEPDLEGWTANLDAAVRAAAPPVVSSPTASPARSSPIGPEEARANG